MNFRAAVHLNKARYYLNQDYDGCLDKSEQSVKRALKAMQANSQNTYLSTLMFDTALEMHSHIQNMNIDLFYEMIQAAINLNPNANLKKQMNMVLEIKTAALALQVKDYAQTRLQFFKIMIEVNREVTVINLQHSNFLTTVLQHITNFAIRLIPRVIKEDSKESLVILLGALSDCINVLNKFETLKKTKGLSLDYSPTLHPIMSRFEETVMSNADILRRYPDEILKFLNDLKSTTQCLSVKILLANTYANFKCVDETILLHIEILNDFQEVGPRSFVGLLLKSLASVLTVLAKQKEEAQFIIHLEDLLGEMQVNLDSQSVHFFCARYYEAKNLGYDWIADLYLKIGQLIIDYKENYLCDPLVQFGDHVLKLNFFKEEYGRLIGRSLLSTDSDDEKSSDSYAPLVSILPMTLFNGRAQSAPAEHIPKFI